MAKDAPVTETAAPSTIEMQPVEGTAAEVFESAGEEAPITSPQPPPPEGESDEDAAPETPPGSSLATLPETERAGEGEPAAEASSVVDAAHAETIASLEAALAAETDRANAAEANFNTEHDALATSEKQLADAQSALAEAQDARAAAETNILVAQNALGVEQMMNAEYKKAMDGLALPAARDLTDDEKRGYKVVQHVMEEARMSTLATGEAGHAQAFLRLVDYLTASGQRWG